MLHIGVGGVMTETQELRVAIDTIWVVVSAAFVFFMSAGFLLLESGLCQRKNLVSILIKNLSVYAIAAVTYWILGFGLQFAQGNSLIGSGGFLLLGQDNSPATKDYQGIFPALSYSGVALSAKFLFHLGFASTSAIIVSGAVAERIKLIDYLCFTLLFVAFIYPLVGHWAWGGGWLQQLEFYDFAGSAIVHTSGGMAALIGILCLGPRSGFQAGATFAPSSMRSATIGCVILWLCWWFFNAGSLMGVSSAVGAIALNTNLAAATGALAGLLLHWMLQGQANLGKMINGLLGGLVAVTAPCAYISPGAAAVIGICAGVLVIYVEQWMLAAGLDDPVGAVPVHLACGVWGTVALGIFSQGGINGVSPAPRLGLIAGGGPFQFGVQLLGILAVAGAVALLSYIFWTILKMSLGLRLSNFEQEKGADVLQHGIAED
jgi:ammonium transporter, Amt family